MQGTLAGESSFANDFIGVDHVQVLCPVGAEDRARRFWRGVVGLAEVDKPEQLRSRGGAWFRCGAQGIHVGAEPGFVPAHRAHPALQVCDTAAFDRLLHRLREAGLDPQEAEVPIAERRMKVSDPFGNLIEFVVGSTG